MRSIGPAVTREQSPAFLRNSNGRLDLPVGQEIRLVRRLLVGDVDQGHVQRRQAGVRLGKLKSDAEQQHAVQQQGEQHGGADRIGAGVDGGSRTHAAGFPRACRSMASNSWPAMLSPNWASSSRMQVGDVTLISVK